MSKFEYNGELALLVIYSALHHSQAEARRRETDFWKVAHLTGKSACSLRRGNVDTGIHSRTLPSAECHARNRT